MALSRVETNQLAEISAAGLGKERVCEGCVAKIPCWRIAWFAPQSINSGGLSAVKKTTRSPVNPASINAGYKLATAVPDVTITATGSLVAFASPNAKCPSPRSSKCVWQTNF